MAWRQAWAECSPRCRPLELGRRLWARPVVLLLVLELEQAPPPEGGRMQSHVRQAATQERERGPEHELEKLQERELARALPPAA